MSHYNCNDPPDLTKRKKAIKLSNLCKIKSIIYDKYCMHISKRLLGISTNHNKEFKFKFLNLNSDLTPVNFSN